MKTRHLFKALLIGVVLVGAGCSVDNSTACVTDTSWDSCITDTQADTGLIGTWTLVEQQLVTPTDIISNPFNGRTLTFTANGTYNGYVEDWSGESKNTTITAGTPSVTHNTECDVEGTLGGSWAAIDVANPELWIVPDGVGSPEVKCKNSTFAGDGIEVESNAASTPLGIGRPETGPTGNLYVKYNYSIGEGGTLLSIVQELPGGVGSNAYLFQR